MILVLAEAHGQRLVLDTEDVESFDVASPRDVHDTPAGQRLGREHLTVTYHLRDGAHGRWVAS